MLGNIMPPTLEKSKRKKKSGFKQKQKQQQTVIVNINKRTPVQRGEKAVPRNNGIEKPKETPKEQPKTYNSFSFSMPQAQQNPIGEYLKVYNKELYSKIEQSLKSKDAVINSSDEAVNPIISVKSAERIPTPLELITPPKSFEKKLQENYLRRQEEPTPLTIGEPTKLDGITTLEEPSQSVSLDEPPEEPSKEEVSKDTVESLKKVDDAPDLFALLASPESTSPTISEPSKRGPGRPKGSTLKSMVERNLMGAEDKIVQSRPVGRPKGTNNAFLRARFEEQQLQLNKNTENPSALPIRAITTDDLTIPQRVARRKTEDTFTKIDEPPKSAPQRRASLSFDRRLGSPL